MTDAVFEVRFAGPQISVQDAGRPGLMRYGVPASGPMDRKSFAAANRALGNPPGAAGVEVSRGGLVLDCVAGAVTLAIAGGGFVVTCGQVTAGSWCRLTVRAGDTLTLRQGPWGSWTYLAFAGALDVPQWLGSAATHSPSGLGGGMIATSGRITVTNAQVHDVAPAFPCPVWARPRQRLTVVLGPQDRCFGPATIATFLASRYVLTDAGDRMGQRLRGPALPIVAGLNLPSEAVLRGSVQVAGDGVPTVLLADHQTTGGYPKIATILSDDIDGLVQLRPRDAVTFTAVTPEKALAIQRLRLRITGGNGA